MKLSVDLVNRFLNSRNPRERVMFLALAACTLLVLDCYILIRPVIGFLAGTGPQIALLQEELNGLRNDQKNKALIVKEWSGKRKKLEEIEQGFIAPNEISVLLENLSNLASESDVKIISLKPSESAAAGLTGPYGTVPIKISALAGTHELGGFLARLESGPKLFKITDLKITENPLETRRHIVELDIQAFRKG